VNRDTVSRVDRTVDLVPSAASELDIIVPSDAASIGHALTLRLSSVTTTQRRALTAPPIPNELRGEQL
jgi:hypothetical protein